MAFLRKEIDRFFWMGFICLLFFSCTKSEERTCFKSAGEFSQLEIPLDSTNSFRLYKNIRYTIYQDSLNKVIVKGGNNLISKVEVKTENYETSITNLNRCNFLRNSDQVVEVEIHCPNYTKIYAEPTDSMIFRDVILSDALWLEIREGGGTVVLDVNATYLSINVSYGTGDYILKGSAQQAEVKIQNNGFADASAFNARYIFVYNNSTGDLRIDLTNSDVLMLLEGTGNILYYGVPDSLNISKTGSGSVIKL